MGMGYRVREILLVDDFARTGVNTRAILTKPAKADSLVEINKPILDQKLCAPS